MKHTSSTNQPPSGTSVPQEDDPMEDDPELSEIADELQKTASYAINPEFKENLHKELLQQFREQHNKESK